jgi:hypothetical protein
MSDLNAKVGAIANHPILTATAGAGTATYGALNKIAESMPVIHSILSNVSMAVGIIASIFGIYVQYQNRKEKRLKDQNENATH